MSSNLHSLQGFISFWDIAVAFIYAVLSPLFNLKSGKTSRKSNTLHQKYYT